MIKAGEELLRLQAENQKLGARIYELSSQVIALEQDKIDLKEENTKLRNTLKEIISAKDIPSFILPVEDIDPEKLKVLMSQAKPQIVPTTGNIVFPDKLFVESKDYL